MELQLVIITNKALKDLYNITKNLYVHMKVNSRLIFNMTNKRHQLIMAQY